MGGTPAGPERGRLGLGLAGPSPHPFTMWLRPPRADVGAFSAVGALAGAILTSSLAGPIPILRSLGVRAGLGLCGYLDPRPIFGRFLLCRLRGGLGCVRAAAPTASPRAPPLLLGDVLDVLGVGDGRLRGGRFGRRQFVGVELLQKKILVGARAPANRAEPGGKRAGHRERLKSSNQPWSAKGPSSSGAGPSSGRGGGVGT